MMHTTDFFKNRRAVQRTCPNAGNACNCIGVCQPIWVDKDDPRTDEEIRVEWAVARINTWASSLTETKPT